MKKVNLKGVNKATWVRLAAFLLVFLNQVAVSIFEFQLLPFTDAQIYEGVSIVVTTLVSIYTAWKNNSLTESAQEADQLLKVKKGDK